ATGVTNWQNQLYGKQLGLLREIAPKATAFAFLVNPNNPNADPDSKDATAAANGLGLVMQVLRAGNGTEIESAFAGLTQQRVGGVIVGVDDFGVKVEQFDHKVGAVTGIFLRTCCFDKNTSVGCSAAASLFAWFTF